MAGTDGRRVGHRGRIREACPSLAQTPRCGYGGLMKMTVDVHAELLAQAKRHAKGIGQPLRAVVEYGLRDAPSRRRFALPDLRVGDPGAPAPLATCSWPELRELIYGDRGAR